MDPSPRRSAARPILQSRFSLEDKLLGLSLSSPSSVQSLSSDTTDANGLDELDEQEIWEMDGSSVDSRPFVDLGKGQPSLPPRISSRGRTASGRSATPERRSPLKDGISLWASSAAKGLSSISVLHPQNIAVRSPTGRILGSETASRRIPAATRMISGLVPQEMDPHKGAVEDGSSRMMPQSAPVNIPDWSRLERKESQRIRSGEIGREEEDEERLPPHEFLAREYARSQASFSVFEGAGRTLKGRDMTRVRNAVLTRTGFLE